MADHNDPNAVNSIFSDIDVSAADLYDLFGFPSDDTGDGIERVYIALTFAAIPEAGVFDTDMLYRIQVAAEPRAVWPEAEERSLKSLLHYFSAVKDKYLGPLQSAEIRVTVDSAGKATVKFMDFPGGSFTKVVDTNQVLTIDTPDGYSIKTFIGGRDDAFFNDLTGFFRSINYAPQFYHVPHTMTNMRELKIPKTLLELEGNDLFNFDPDNPTWGYEHVHGKDGFKKELPSEIPEWKGGKFRKDENGNYRFVYSGFDCQNGKNINAIVFEIPLAFITPKPEDNRIVNTWGESWVLKAANKIETIPDDPFWLEHPSTIFDSFRLDDELKKYKLVDTDGQPFADAGLSEREDNRQLGANNFWLAPHFIKRLGHLGWGFGPSISALGLQTSFDHDNSPVSVYKTYSLATAAFPRVKKTLFQPMRMPDDSWNKKGLNIPLRRPFEIFVPNVCAIDMDTTGTWPFGRRLEDQVATRFLSVFLDMDAEFNGRKYHIDLLNDQSLWDNAPIEPKTPPNPLKNDKEFLTEFPYLATPW